jgi:hypothetical protein
MNPYSEIYPDSFLVKAIHVSDGLIVIYQLDSHERWIVHVRHVLGGLKFEDLFFEVVGKVDERWLDNHFEEEEFFEDWEKFAE